MPPRMPSLSLAGFPRRSDCSVLHIPSHHEVGALQMAERNKYIVRATYFKKNPAQGEKIFHTGRSPWRSPWWSALANVVVYLVAALVCHRTNWHARVQAWLARRGDTSAAAGIAALMLDLSAEELLARASARFRHVTLDMITEENMTAPLQGSTICPSPPALGAWMPT